MSTSPKVDSASAAMRSTSSGTLMSAGTLIARPPSALMRATTPSARVSIRSSGRVFTTTDAPSRANASATAAPIPHDAPVTIATLSPRRPISAELGLLVAAGSCASPDAPAAVDDEVVALHEARAAGRQEHRGGDVVLRHAGALHGGLVGQVGPD